MCGMLRIYWQRCRLARCDLRHTCQIHATNGNLLSLLPRFAIDLHRQVPDHPSFMPFPPERVGQDAQQLSGVLSSGFEVHAGRAGFETEQDQERFGFRPTDAVYGRTDELL